MTSALRAAGAALIGLALGLAGQSPAAQDRPAGVASNADLFAQGNDHYAAGRHEEAERAYRQILDRGYDSAALRYNLGNALFKMRRLGPAILQYEKALALDPDDGDARANLQYARSLTADKITTTGAQTASFFMERLLELTHLDQDAAALALLWVAFGLLAAVRIVSVRPWMRRGASRGLALLLVPLALLGCSFGVKLYRAATVRQAIVLSERLDVRSGPDEENTTLFTVHEGLKVRLRGQEGSWLLVSLDNGLNGWVPGEALGRI